MRYFFNFETYSYTGKVNNKELFYLRLLKKRMKDSYTIYRDGCPLKEHTANYGVKNLFVGNLIEFEDKKTFSKFKLDYSGLLNPTINNWSQHISSVISFEVDDDFEDKAEKYYKEFITCEKFIEYKASQKNVVVEYENYISSLINSLKGTINTLDENIEEWTNSPLVKKSDIATIKKNIEKIESMRSDLEKLPRNEIGANEYYNRYYGYSNPDRARLSEEYVKNYNSLYHNVHKHDIP